MANIVKRKKILINYKRRSFDWGKFKTTLPSIEIELKRTYMAIIEQINEGIKEAMRRKDMVRLGTLRMLKSKVMAVDARAAIPDADVVKIFKTYLSNLQEALAIAEGANRVDVAGPLKIEIAIVQEFLPKALSKQETKEIVLQAIADSGAKGKRDLGLVMKAIMKINASVDGKLAKDLASELLPE